MLRHCVHYDSHMPTIQGVYNWVLDININFHVMHAQREDYDSFLIINQVISGREVLHVFITACKWRNSSDLQKLFLKTHQHFMRWKQRRHKSSLEIISSLYYTLRCGIAERQLKLIFILSNNKRIIYSTLIWIIIRCTTICLLIG